MTDLTKEFTWGRIVKDHAVGPYTIREFHPRKMRAGILREVDETVTHFHGYAYGSDMNESWESYDAALAGLRAR